MISRRLDGSPIWCVWTDVNPARGFGFGPAEKNQAVEGFGIRTGAGVECVNPIRRAKAECVEGGGGFCGGGKSNSRNHGDEVTGYASFVVRC